MSSAADKLNKLKVADLKPILQKVGLPVSGKKNELVDRILASKEALAAAGLGDEPAPAPQEDMNADLPDLPAEEPAAPNTIPTPAPAPVAAAPAAEPPAAAAPTTTAPDAPNLDDEAERRRKRAERFGIPFVDEKKKAAPPAKPASGAGASKASGAKPAAAPAAPASPEEQDRLRKRAERFGLPVATAGAASNGRTKGAAKEKAPAAAAAAEVDPAEEERKRKRAERFGKVSGAPVEKKAKADS